MSNLSEKDKLFRLFRCTFTGCLVLIVLFFVFLVISYLTLDLR